MNTVALEHGTVHDALQDEAGAAAWLHAVADRIAAETGTVPGRPDPDAVRRAAGELRALRDALRRLAAQATGDPRPPATATRMTGPRRSPHSTHSPRRGPNWSGPPTGTPHAPSAQTALPPHSPCS